ncbi:DUF2061 domain-containing protein [Pseudooceanicola sediminis]|uniref:DUF2061 domain-containing protein n=1 Tax=Pseudooceanicola sediminis TaxID=2211117 RepID=A0A399J9C1_9RHOB|nr:DUF2061 domain-containing protein [Pseudooceanicola sediminis]KAA2316332.1 DUF2061 domain-containing protein [Puniceibacterium sp. HSS470]RII39246.1 DUF2061 domain-containing protein [Pseudooceanicola sediminis]|tara:strand:+ start:27740 stop:27946 length:207 start_codon:yes stop_codon:yes gene_type:complete
METAARSLVKAILWTCLGTVMMALVGYLFTGSLRLGGGMALVNSGLGLVSYILYERLWDRIRWGRLHG